MSMKVIVTGATSFLGRYIVSELESRGAEVYAIIRPESKSKMLFENNPSVTTVLTNMDNVEEWKKTIVSADYFIHLGWDGIGADGRANTTIQEKNLKDAIGCFYGAADLGCKAFLFAGSQAEYGPQTETISESTKCNPVTEYGRFKLKVSEKLLAIDNIDMKYYHTRIFSVYGEGDHKWALVPDCIRTLCGKGEMKLSSCKQFWNYMYATDAAYAICQLLLSQAKSGIYNIASTDTRPLYEFVEQIHLLCGHKGSLRFGEYNPSEKPANLRPSIEALEKAVGVIPHTPFEAAIERMVDLYKKTGEQ